MADDSLDVAVDNTNSLELEINPPYVGSAFSPEVDIEETSSTITVTITDARGDHSYSIPNPETAIADAEAATTAANTAAGNANSAASAASTATSNANAAATAANNAATLANQKAGQASDAAAIATQAANDANGAAEVASAKATLANTAAAAATSAASAAGNAASAANSAANYADIATRDASAAADAANSAANAANAAAGAAESATATVDAAVASANSAASYANEKGGLASNAANAANDAATLANTKAGLANDAATLANQKATAANTAAGAANDAAELANTKAGLANTAASAANAAAAAAESAAALAANYTEAYLPLVTSGVSESLLSTNGEVVTFAERVSTHDGACKIVSMRGNTVRWNQIFPSNQSTSGSGITLTNNGDGTYTVNGTASATFVSTATPNVTLVAGHKYYLSHGDVNAVRVQLYQEGVGGTDGPNIVTARSANGIARMVVSSGVQVDNVEVAPMLVDLTKAFGAGNEPATVAEFERMYPEDYYPYDAGSLLSVNIEGIESAGVTREIPAATYFPNGMRSAGSVYDELTSNQAITRIGSRAYQNGDESDTSVITDGTTTHYALSTPVVVDIDPPLNLAYPTEQGGTESIVIPTGEQSAAPTMAIVYAYNADGVRDLSHAIIATIEGATASTNYAIGGYFVHGGKLYKATSAIATGETINPGTNCTQTTVMAEILALA